MTINSTPPTPVPFTESSTRSSTPRPVHVQDATDSTVGGASAPSDTAPAASVGQGTAGSDEGRWSRRVEIEQAKGVLAALFGIHADTAFAVLAKQSQSRNVAVYALAVRILAAMRETSDEGAAVRATHRSLNQLLDN